MKNYLQSVMIPAIMMVMVMAASCSKDNDATTTPSIDEPEAEYTVMVYGSGGGDLDYYLDFNFHEVEAFGYLEDVQFTAMFKYSSSWQEMDEIYEGTRLLTMEPNGEMSNTKVGDADMRIDDPQNLADFIIDAKRRLPAKKYILVINNHGSGFDIRDQPTESSYVTKVVCSDDNTDYSALSIFEFEEALELAGEKIDMLYWQACLMNTMENVCQVYDHFDYIMGSSHSGYTGNNYAIMMTGLLKYDNLVDFGEYFISNMLETWQEVGVSASCDMSLIDTSKVEAVMEQIKDACDILCECRDNLVEGTYMDYLYKCVNGDSSESAKSYYFSDEYSEECPIYSYTEYGLHYFFIDGRMFIDLSSSLSLFSYYLSSSALSVAASKLDNAIDDMYLYQETINLPEYLYNLSVSVVWMPDIVYNYSTFDGSEFGYAQNNYEFEYKSYSKLYPLLEFDKVTGWGSNYLARNVVQAIGYNDEDDTFYIIER